MATGLQCQWEEIGICLVCAFFLLDATRITTLSLENDDECQ